MNLLNELPVHPSKLHPLTGKPLRAIWVRPDGRAMWPVMGGAEDDDAAAKAAADAKADADAKAKADADAKAAADAKSKSDDLGFPKDTPVAEMTSAQQAAYWKDKSRKHEERATEWAKVGKTPAEVQQELEKLRTQTMTDHEKAVEEAKNTGKVEGARQASLAAARMAFEFALDHDADKNDQSDLIDTLDLSKVVNENGEIDTAKVRSIAGKLAPAGKDGGRRRDFGAGDRRTDKSTGVASGRDLYRERHGKTTTSTST